MGGDLRANVSRDRAHGVHSLAVINSVRCRGSPVVAPAQREFRLVARAADRRPPLSSPAAETTQSLWAKAWLGWAVPPIRAPGRRSKRSRH
jgi:hypothetical protein